MHDSWDSWAGQMAWGLLPLSLPASAANADDSSEYMSHHIYMYWHFAGLWTNTD